MDFIIGLPKIYKQHDAIMVVVDNLSKVAHLVVVKYNNSTSDIAQILIKDIVRLSNIPKKIVSDRDVMFTSRFWKDPFGGLGTKLTFGITYHLKIDGK